MNDYFFKNKHNDKIYIYKNGSLLTKLEPSNLFIFPFKPTLAGIDYEINPDNFWRSRFLVQKNKEKIGIIRMKRRSIQIELFKENNLIGELQMKYGLFRKVNNSRSHAVMQNSKFQIFSNTEEKLWRIMPKKKSGFSWLTVDYVMRAKQQEFHKFPIDELVMILGFSILYFHEENS